jgi:GTP-binding protein HflX
LDHLLAVVTDHLGEERHTRDLTLSFDQGRKRAWLHDQGLVTSEAEGETGWALSVLWTARQERAFREL